MDSDQLSVIGDQLSVAGVDWHGRFSQQATWTRELRAYLFRHAGLATARRVLEVGCGTGALLAEMSTAAALFGLDIESAHLAKAAIHAPRARLARGDAYALPYPPRTFDITLCHFLLLWLKDPQAALREMARVTQRGGYVLALAEPDYSGRVDKPAELVPLGQWQAESLRRQGADPGLGRRLAGLFAEAGIMIIETGRLAQGRNGPPTPGEREMEWAVIAADLTGVVEDKVIQKYKALDEAAWARGERVLFVPTSYAWGRVE